MFKICFIFNSYINSSNVPRGDTKGCNQIKTSKTKQQKWHMLAVFVPRSPPPKRSAMTETWGWCWNVMSSVWQDRRFHIHGDKHILLRLFTNSHQKNIWDSALRLTNSSKKIRKKKTFQSHIWYKELVVYWNKKLHTSKKHNDGTNLSYKLFGSVCAAAAGVICKRSAVAYCKISRDSSRLPPMAMSESNMGVTLIKQAGQARCPILSRLETSTNQTTWPGNREGRTCRPRLPGRQRGNTSSVSCKAFREGLLVARI